MRDKPLNVTRPSLPPLEEFVSLLETVWESGTLSNCGPLHEKLEEELCEYLEVGYVSLFANGTIALMTALRAMQLKGEVITTPFSFVATSHALLWNGLQPVFADINGTSLNLEPTGIETAITDATSAIFPVHCYGTPCDVEAIDAIAKRHDIAVIYDAAHAFGVRDHGGSILRYGDLSVLSFHATKVFNTFEGGAVISNDVDMKRRVDNLRNFGISADATVDGIGLNGKMSEVGAAMGLAQLRHVDSAIEARGSIAMTYRQLLGNIPGITPVAAGASSTANFSYFPILVGDEYGSTRDQLVAILARQNIFARRYFYPLISTMPMYRTLSSSHEENLPVATSIANQILCLPISSTMTRKDCEEVAAIVSANAS